MLKNKIFCHQLIANRKTKTFKAEIIPTVFKHMLLTGRSQHLIDQRLRQSSHELFILPLSFTTYLHYWSGSLGIQIRWEEVINGSLQRDETLNIVSAVTLYKAGTVSTLQLTFSDWRIQAGKLNF